MQSSDSGTPKPTKPIRNPSLEILFLSLLVGVGIVALVVVFWFPPTETRFYPRCLFHDVTGLHCPGCGGFRAWHNLLNGRLLKALSMNVLAVTLLPGLVVWLVFQRIFFPSSDFWSLRAYPWIHLFLAGIVIAFGVLRNIPFAPFSWFAPQ